MALILVVDDEPGIRELLSRWIVEAKHEVTEADSADAALVKMAEQPAAVVFCDIQMPGHDGIWLTTEIRKRYPATAVVLATSVDTIAAQTSMQSGVMAYLLKPFKGTAVVRALTTALDWHLKAVESGPQPSDAPDKLREWLESLA